MHSPFLVSTTCPECGGPIRHPEGTYTFTCGFCSSVLRIAEEGQDLRYVIPARFRREDIPGLVKRPLLEKRGEFGRLLRLKSIVYFYKPFWYVKGMIYCALARMEKNEVIGKTWYHTFQANREFFPYFHSLGVRSEVLTIFPLDAEAVAGGVPLPVEMDREAAREGGRRAARGNMNVTTSPTSELFSLDMDDPERLAALHVPSQATAYKEVYLIGEKLFLLYYPVLQVVAEGSVCDWTFSFEGITGSILSEAKGDAGYRGVTSETKELASAPVFLTHRCQNCGHDLTAGDFDVVYYCTSCFRLWLLENNDYSSLDMRVIEPVRRTGETVFVPFWEFTVEIESPLSDTKLATVGDLSRAMKMGRHMLRNEDPERALTFLVPALVTRNAGAVMKLAARINMFQKDLPVSPSREFPYDRMLHASLPQAEAEAMLEPLLFAVLGRNDRGTLEFLRTAEITVRERQLLWYPFEDRGNMLADHFHQYHFPKRAMDVNVY